MKQKTIHVLKVEPQKSPVLVTLENRLEALQKAVSIGAEYTGLIEIIDLSPKVCILCNEEGKIIGLEPNRRLGMDILCGVFYVTGQDKSGNLTSLSPADAEYYTQLFTVPQQISREEADDTIFTHFEII